MSRKSNNPIPHAAACVPPQRDTGATNPADGQCKACSVQLVLEGLRPQHYTRLVHIARKHMGPRLLELFDPEEIVHEVMCQVILGVQMGKLENMGIDALLRLAERSIERKVKGVGRRVSRHAAKHALYDPTVMDALVPVSPTGVQTESQCERLRQWLLARLQEPYRQVLILYYLQAKTPAEIARLLHVSKDAVYQRLARARQRIHQLLDDYPAP